MVSVKEAYKEAKKLTDSSFLQQILSFDGFYGFIFSSHKDGVDVGNLCIMISKEDSTQSALVPIIFENLDFLEKGKKILLTVVK